MINVHSKLLRKC